MKRLQLPVSKPVTDTAAPVNGSTELALLDTKGKANKLYLSIYLSINLSKSVCSTAGTKLHRSTIAYMCGML